MSDKRRLLSHLLSEVSELERKVEIARQVLTENAKYNVETIYYALSSKNPLQQATSQILAEMMAKNRASVSDKDGLFLDRLLDPHGRGYITKEALRSVLESRESIIPNSRSPTKVLPLEIEYSLSRVLQLELEGQKLLQPMIDEIIGLSNSDDLFQMIDNKDTGKIIPEDLIKFCGLSKHRRNLQNMNRIIQRISGSDCGYISKYSWRLFFGESASSPSKNSDLDYKTPRNPLIESTSLASLNHLESDIQDFKELKTTIYDSQISFTKYPKSKRAESFSFKGSNMIASASHNTESKYSMEMEYKQVPRFSFNQPVQTSKIDDFRLDSRRNREEPTIQSLASKIENLVLQAPNDDDEFMDDDIDIFSICEASVKGYPGVLALPSIGAHGGIQEVDALNTETRLRFIGFLRSSFKKNNSKIHQGIGLTEERRLPELRLDTQLTNNRVPLAQKNITSNNSNQTQSTELKKPDTFLKEQTEEGVLLLQQYIKLCRVLEEARICLALRYDIVLSELFEVISGGAGYVDIKGFEKWCDWLGTHSASEFPMVLTHRYKNLNKVDLAGFEAIIAPSGKDYLNALKQRSSRGILKLMDYSFQTREAMKSLIEGLLFVFSQEILIAKCAKFKDLLEAKHLSYQVVERFFYKNEIKATKGEIMRACNFFREQAGSTLTNSNSGYF